MYLFNDYIPTLFYCSYIVKIVVVVWLEGAWKELENL